MVQEGWVVVMKVTLLQNLCSYKIILTFGSTPMEMKISLGSAFRGYILYLEVITMVEERLIGLIYALSWLDLS